MPYDAFQSADAGAAQAYAQKAASRPGAQRLDALNLYGDALFKNGEYKRAKDVYIGVRAKVSAERIPAAWPSRPYTRSAAGRGPRGP